MLEYYNSIDQDKLCDGITEIVAMDFGELFLYNSGIMKMYSLEFSPSYHFLSNLRSKLPFS